MAIYEERLQRDLAQIKGEVARLGEMVKKAVKEGVEVLFSGDEPLANRIVLGDFPINRQCSLVNRLCHGFIARHLPSAGHLRLITAVMQIVIDLERMGDYARTIARETVHMYRPPQGLLRRDLETLSSHAQTFLHQALEAFATEHAALAQATIHQIHAVEVDMDVTFHDMVESGAERGSRAELQDLLALDSVAYMMERIGNRSTNICEATLFILTGEAPARPVHEIVFLDGDDACLAPMAVAIAKKGYGELARFRSAGRQPAATLDGAMVEFMRRHGYSMQGVFPKGVDVITPTLAKVHILIGLDGPVRGCGLEIPFHTAFLDWTLESAAEGAPGERFEPLYRSLTGHLRELMELLHGEEGI